MLKSYLRITWRNLKKDRQFTILNLLGLSVGLACTLLIGLWVADELNMDKYNAKDDQLYQVMANFKNDDGIKTGTHTAGILAPALKQELPGIEHSVTVFPASWFNSKGTISAGDKHLKADGQYAGREFFDVFTCPMVSGDRNSLFADKQGVLISEETARNLFGTTENSIGKTIKWEQSEFSGDYAVKGVFQHNPANATEQFDLVFNYDLALERRDGVQKWGNSDPSTFVIVKKGADIDQLNAKLKDFLKGRNDGVTLFLMKYSDRYLHDHFENGVQAGGRITYVKLFSIIALFILVIACINFMNLSTAKAAHRAKEVGIKKVVGAPRSYLIAQYLGESIALSFIALSLSLLLVELVLPSFNGITGKTLAIHITLRMVLTVTGITALTGLLAGSYPAFYLSGFRPVTVLKGTIRTSWSELWTRKGLVVFQFTLSVIFIAAVIIVYRQVEYIQSKNVGYERDHLAHFEVPFGTDSASLQKVSSFINELKSVPGVTNVSSYYHTLTGRHGGIGGFEWPGRPPGMDINFANLEVGFNFLPTAGIRLKEGRDITPDRNRARDEIVFNETAIRMMGLKDPIGKTVRFWGHDRQIVGVVKDFNFESLYQNIKPCFFQEYPAMPNILVKIRTGSEKATLAAIKTIYSQFNPGEAFEYKFLDEDYQALYASEQRVSALSKYFAGLAIFISCLGLFGLAAFTAQKRKKELGIRKVVGATVLQLAFLLSREFFVLVLLAIGIAFPLVYLGMHKWLDSFAYRTTIHADTFLLAGVAALTITLLTIGYQSLKAAAMNPVESLRNE